MTSLLSEDEGEGEVLLSDLPTGKLVKLMKLVMDP